MKINWKYAIGEILIVIIGISLAFSLNNWKERRADRRLTTLYLQSLALDVEEEMKQLAGNNETAQRKLQLIREVRPLLGRSDVRRDSVVQKIFELAQIVNFYPERTTYETLVNSGDLSLLRNFQLRRQLEGQNALHDVVEQGYRRLEIIHEKYLADFFIYKINFGELRRGNQDFLDDPLLGNILSSLEGAYYILLNDNKRCLASNESLLVSLREELGE